MMLLKLGIVFLVMAFIAFLFYLILPKEKISLLITFIILASVGFTTVLTNGANARIENFCEEYNICYELVETVAEYTDYSKEDVAKFFTIVQDDVEAWEAIKMLDSSLTDQDIDAIMRVSALKQEE